MDFFSEGLGCCSAQRYELVKPRNPKKRVPCDEFHCVDDSFFEKNPSEKEVGSAWLGQRVLFQVEDPRKWIAQ